MREKWLYFGNIGKHNPETSGNNEKRTVKPKIRHLQRRGNEVIEVDFGEIYGRRKRVTVKDEDAGQKLLDQYDKDLERAGKWWTGIPDTERLQIESTVIAIRQAGFTLPHVWAEFQRLRQAAQAVETPCKYSDAVEEWGRTKLAAGKGERYVKAGKSLLLKFAEGRTEQWIHEFRSEELEQWLNEQTKERGWSLSTKQTYQLMFSSLWSVAKRKKWATQNIVDFLEPISRPGVDVKIYTNVQVRAFMAAMIATERTQRAPISPVLQGWCCMRPEEVLSVKALRNGHKPFDWGDIDMKHARITVRKEVAKKGDQRVIRVQPAGMAWLRFCQKLECPLPPPNERRLIDSACSLIHFDDCIRDGLRKNCATHLRTIYKNDYEVIKDMGNSVKVLLEHYAELQTPPELSKEWWKIDPAEIERFMKSREWKNILTASS